MMARKICIIGAGGLAKEVFALIKDLGRADQVAAFLDLNADESSLFCGLPIRKMDFFDPKIHSAVIAIGSPAIRRKVVETQLPADTFFETLIHPTALILTDPGEIGTGAVIFARSIVSSDARIGAHCQLNYCCTIGHDCAIGDFFTTAPGVHLSGENRIGDRVYFGTNSATRQQISICDDAVIGMSAAIMKNIDQAGTYVGNPARMMPS